MQTLCQPREAFNASQRTRTRRNEVMRREMSRLASCLNNGTDCARPLASCRDDLARRVEKSNGRRSSPVLLYADSFRLEVKVSSVVRLDCAALVGELGERQGEIDWVSGWLRTNNSRAKSQGEAKSDKSNGEEEAWCV